ncbi:non-homologous end-joining DNA ligase [soil metagenome]
MLASPAGELPSLKGWTIEPKWDGIRVIADISPRQVSLWSRNRIDKSREFPALVAALRVLATRGGPMVLDGELVAIDAKGKPLRFQALQARNVGRGSNTALIVFDCLSAGGRSWIARPWTERHKALVSLVPKSARGLVRRGDSAPCGSRGAARIIEAARREDWEGLIVKRMDSAYDCGKRSPLWRKIKLEREQEFVIGGYTHPTEGVAREFGALLVGYYGDDGALHYAGKVGTGYTQKTLAMLGQELAPLIMKASPFVDVTKRQLVHSVWVKPKLVAQVKYNEMTKSGLLRQPSYLGLRDDKRARDVRLESDTSPSAILDVLQCGS